MKRESFIDIGPEVQPALTAEAYHALRSETEQPIESDSVSPVSVERTSSKVTQIPVSEDGWMSLSECADSAPGTFFPSDGKGVEVAKRICERCVVKEDCLEYAINTRQDHGVWGGTSERERRRIIKRRTTRT